MNEAQIRTELRTVFERIFDREIEIRESMTADDVEGWDSLTHIRLMVSVEQKFKVRFSAAEIGSAKDVGDLIRMIDQKVRLS